jgi:hypothetical protein
MGELMSAWRDLERRIDELAPDDPRLPPCEAVAERMRDAYQRLHDVYPRSQEDTDLVRSLIAESRGLEAVAAEDG